MKYALVIDNNIENVGYLPRKLNGIPEPQLNDNGWYKVVPDATLVEAWQSYTSDYAFDGQNVIETKNVTNMPLDDYKVEKYTRLAKEIEKYIYTVYPSYKQLSALAGYYDAATNQSIVDGVKTYFDIAQVIKTDLFGYATHAEVRDIYFRKNFAADVDQPDDWRFWGQ